MEQKAMEAIDFGTCIREKCWAWHIACKYKPNEMTECRTDEDVSPSFRRANRTK